MLNGLSDKASRQSQTELCVWILAEYNGSIVPGALNNLLGSWAPDFLDLECQGSVADR